MAGILAIGFRLTIPAVAWQPPAEAPLEPQRDEKANIIQFADVAESVDLRKWGRVGNYTVAEMWKALKHTDEQEQLFSLLLARLEDEDDKVRLQAAHFLSLLNDPRSEPRIEKVLTDVQDKRLHLAGLTTVKPVWTLGPVPDADGFRTVHPVETTAIDLAAKYTVAGKLFEWQLTKPSSPDRPLYEFHKLFGASPKSSVYSFFRLECATPQRAQLLIGSEDGVKVWHNGALVHAVDVVRPNIQLDDVVTLNLQPGTNDVLMRVHTKNGLGGQYLHFRHLGGVQITIPEKPDGLSLADRLRSATQGNQPIDPKFLTIDWLAAVKEGDPIRGKKLFSGDMLGCAKCHAATPTAASSGGPSLADAGKRFTVPYLVESVLAPSMVVSPVFKASTIVTNDGKVTTGLVISETADILELLLPDTKKQTIAKRDIEERKPADVSAMPAGVVKTPDELRDVLSYLLINPAD
jgi:putative heme-binding domain-containing protein